MGRFAGPSRCIRVILLSVCCLFVGSASAAGAPHGPGPADLPVLEAVAIEGSSVFGEREIQEQLDLEVGERLPRPPDELNRRLERRYHRRGYTYARAETTFDATTGRLSITVDEGRFDAVEFRGVDADVAAELADELELAPGRAFNRREARGALGRLLAETSNHLEPDTRRPKGAADGDGISLGRAGPFELVDRAGTRVLVVQLRKDVGDFSVTFGTEGREDWYSPVDGLNPALGFNGTVFAGDGINHTFVGGYLSYKFEGQRPGYAFGLERSLFEGPRLFVGAQVHDLTASDDAWRLSSTEQSLVALGFKNTFRDYYRRRGYQLHAALRPHGDHELLVSWRDERQEGLVNETNYSLFRRDHVFPANRPADVGDVHALVLGYTWDTRGFAGNSNETTFLRHQVDDLYGTWGSQDQGVRLEWTSEISSPGALGGDFDFRRHILNARAYTRPSPRQRVHARLMVGLSDGALPPQRLFALGGIGSVRGYDFKEALGGQMALMNVEYKLRLRRRGGLTGVVFADAGRVYSPVDASRTDWLTGVGLGLEFGNDLRLDFGYRLDDIPQSLQILVRLQPTF